MHDVKKTVGFVAGMALCLSVPVAYAANDIVVGVAVGLSGANSVVAPSVVQAADLAVDQINAAGGVLGRKLRLEIVDDSSSAAGAQKAYDVLVFQKKVDAIVSMETSAARNAALPIVTRGRIPFIYTSFYEGRSCNKYMYINAWVPEQQVAPMVDYFTRQKDAKTFFSDRQRLCFRARHAGVHAQVHRENRRQGRR